MACLMLCFCDTLNQSMRHAIPDTKCKNPDRRLAFRDRLVQVREQNLLIPNIAISQHHHIEWHVLVSLLDRCLQRIQHLGAAKVGRERLCMSDGFIESFLTICDTLFPEERIARAKGANVELDANGKRLEEDFERLNDEI